MPTIDRTSFRRLSVSLVLMTPGALAFALAFRSGGYAPAATSLVATELLVIVALWSIIGRDPLPTLSKPLTIVVAAFAGLATWTALSASWSLSPELGTPESTRVVLYSAGLVFGGLVAASERRMRLMVGGVLVALVALCLTALASRTLPDVLDVTPRLPERLSYPLSYWNALGSVAALALILALHFCVADASRRGLQVLSAAVIPPVVATLVASTSAGAAAGALAGVCIYALMARPRALAPVLIALAIPAAVAAWFIEHAPVARTPDPGPAVTTGAHRAALLVVACSLVAAGLRVAVRRIERPRPFAHIARPATLTLVLVVLFAGATVATAGVGIRVKYWDVAADMARSEPVRGEGAGTFALVWPRERHKRAHTNDAHSLYIETLGELGLVGAALLALGLGAAGRALVRHARGGEGDRELRCALLAVGGVWMLHAGVDWIWEQPAVSLPVFAMIGAGLARPRAGPPADGSSRTTSVARVALVAACGLAALAPARLAIASADLEASLRAARRGQCDEARRRALESLRTRASSDAQLVLASCALRTAPAAALIAVNRAIASDPHDWRVHYDKALVLATLGRDPHPEIGVAQRLNGREDRVLFAVARFATADPATWRAEAAQLRFALP